MNRGRGSPNYLPSEAEPSRAILAEKRLSTVPGDSVEFSTVKTLHFSPRFFGENPSLLPSILR